MQDWTCVNVGASACDGAIVLFDTEVEDQHWAYYSIDIPAEYSACEVVLSARLLIDNVECSGIRLRVQNEAIGVRNGWVDFSGRAVAPPDPGVSVWPFDGGVLFDVCIPGLRGKVVVVGVMLLGKGGAIRYSGNGSKVVVRRAEFTFENPTGSARKTETHSAEFAGRAVDLCKGVGVEIGALHKPMPLDAHVIYLDHYKTEELKQAYKNDERVPRIRQVQVVWQDTSYPFFDDNAFDFVVNSHVLEHVSNPGRQIEEWLRIIRPGGVLYMIVPDKNYCFDRNRKTTPVDHLMEEFDDNVSTTSIEHYRDYIVGTNGEDGISRDTSDEAIEAAWKQQGSIHVHTFDPPSMREFLNILCERLGAEFIHFDPRGLNMHCALRKRPLLIDTI